MRKLLVGGQVVGGQVTGTSGSRASARRALFLAGLLLVGARGGAVAQFIQLVSLDAGNGTGGTAAVQATARQPQQTWTPLPQYSFFVAGAATIEHLVAHDVASAPD